MTSAIESYATCLADYYLLATVLLAGALVASAAVRQPARKLAIAKSSVVGLVLLAALCALPGWSLVYLVSGEAPAPAVSPMSARQLEVTDDEAITPLATQAREVPLEAAGAPLSSPVVAAPAHDWPAISWSGVFVMAHVIGAATVAMWLLLGSLAARRLRRAAKAAPAELAAVFAEIIDREDASGRRGELLVSERIDTAVALGVWRPVVMLPAEWVRSQSPDQLRTALAHEAAHVRNHDLRWLAVSRALFTLLWAHPLYWLLRRRMRLDQETLADAAAAEVTSRQRYAEQLVAWARDVAKRPTMRLSSAVGLWEGPSQLRQRIMLLIDEGFIVLCNCSQIWWYSAITIAMAGSVGLSLVTVAPQTLAESVVVASTGAPPRESDEPEPEDTGANADEPQDALFPLGAVADGEHVPPFAPEELEANIILGRCVDENNKPLVGVEALLIHFNQTDRTSTQIDRQQTDDAGQYRFSLADHFRRIFPDGKTPGDGPFSLGQHFIGVAVRAADRVSAGRMHTPAHITRTGAAFSHVMPPAATLRGRVTDPDAQPVEGALLSVEIPGIPRWEGILSARTDADGRYEINDLPPFDVEEFKRQEEARREAEKAALAARPDGVTGRFVVQTRPMLTVEHTDFATQKTDYERVPGTLDVQLDAAAIIEGRVVSADTGRPAADVTVEARTAVPSDFWPRPDTVLQHYAATVRTDAEGRFRFSTLPAGTYNVWPESEGWLHPGVGAVEATADEPTTLPDFPLSRGGTIRARLVSAADFQPIEIDPADKASFAIAPEQWYRGRPLLQQLVKPHRDGTFELRAMPGENLLIFQAVVSGDQVKGVAARREGLATTKVDVVEGETVSIDVPVDVPPQPDELEQAVPEVPQQSGRASHENASSNSDEDQRVELPVVVAQHVLLLDGKDIITWVELEEKIAALPEPSLAHPRFYITRGAREAGVAETAKTQIWQIHRKYELRGHSEGSLSPRADLRYDGIKDESDLTPDDELRVEGIVINREGKPVAGAEVILVTPVDETIAYKTYHAALVEGRVRNRLEHVITDSDAKGRFTLYPPSDARYYVVALHPAAGFNIARAQSFIDERQVRLLPWAALLTELGVEPGADQSASLRTRLRQENGYPELVFNQYWSDLKREEPTNIFGYTHIPPIFDTNISREFAQDEGGSFGLSAASVSLLPGETRRIDLGPLSEKQREELERHRDDLRRRREESRERHGAAVTPAPLRFVQATQRVSASQSRPPVLLSYGDGKPDGKKSYGGSGHLIRFELPEGVTKVRGVRIHGSRYGYPQPPDEDIEITFLSENQDEILHSEGAPYRSFKRGKESWVRVMLDKEVELPPKFWVALNFNAERTKGVYVSYDTSTEGQYSRMGLPGDEDEPKETDFGGDWMVQVMLSRPER